MLKHELPQQVVLLCAGLCKAAITKAQVAVRMIDFVIMGAFKKNEAPPNIPKHLCLR